MHFADRTFGSADAALAVARAWRDAVLAAVPPLLPGAQATRRTRQHAAGLPGLYRIKPSPNRAASWSARLAPPGGRLRIRSFSTARHGEDGAKALAEAWLLGELALLEGAPAAPPGQPEPAPGLAPSPAPEPPGTDEEASYGISRAVSPKGRAHWHVAVARSGARVQASFPDLTYGGQAQALTVAHAWRDAVMAVVAPLTNVELRQVVRSVRRDGMPGVYYNAARQTWVAVLTLPGRREIKRSFKVSTYGEAEARVLAEAERLDMLDALENGRDPALRSPAALAAAKRDFRPAPGASLAAQGPDPDGPSRG